MNLDLYLAIFGAYVFFLLISTKDEQADRIMSAEKLESKKHLLQILVTATIGVFYFGPKVIVMTIINAIKTYISLKDE